MSLALLPDLGHGDAELVGSRRPCCWAPFVDLIHRRHDLAGGVRELLDRGPTALRPTNRPPSALAEKGRARAQIIGDRGPDFCDVVWLWPSAVPCLLDASGAPPRRAADCSSAALATLSDPFFFAPRGRRPSAPTVEIRIC